MLYTANSYKPTHAQQARSDGVLDLYSGSASFKSSQTRNIGNLFFVLCLSLHENAGNHH